MSYYSQNDPAWGGNEYDTASAWSGNPTMDRWGCAVTAAAMVMKYHGIDQDPGSLNTWLKSQTDGYLRAGWLNWLAISRYTRILGGTILEYRRGDTDTAAVDEDLDNDRPVILETTRGSGSHFVVANGKTDSTYSIRDPENEANADLTAYENTFRSTRRLLPTNTNLSALLIIADKALTVGLSGGELTEELPLSDDNGDGTSGQPFWLYQINQPDDDDYELELTADEVGDYQFEIYGYDQDANPTVKQETVHIDSDETYTYSFSFTQDEGAVFPDTTVPTVTGAETMDQDGNGYLDAVRLVFAEEIDDALLNLGEADGWDVVGAGGEQITTGDNSNDNELILTFDEAAEPDTGVTPTITYVPTKGPVSTHDLAGNQLEAYEGVAEDKALPVLLSAVTRDSDANGQIDGVELTFSEDIDDDLLDIDANDGWDADGYDGELIGTGETDNDNVLTLTFDESGENDTDATPDVSYGYDEDETSTHDLAGNELAADTWAATDGAAPTTPAATPVAGDYTSDQTITLVSTDGDTQAASIYYTTDGTDPSAENGTLYDAPIAVGTDTTIKAIAYDNAGNISEILTAAYGIAPVISAESSSTVGSSSVTITWTTDDPATSRVIYDTVSRPVLGEAPNYGYANSTVEADTDPKVTAHSVVVSGLTAGTTYYYRTVSRGSPEAVSGEKSFSTSSSGTVAGATTSSDGGGGGGGAAACGDTKPGSAPGLTAAIAGTNSVTLVWTQATAPVSYYLVTYGESSGTQTYGNPNVGGAGTTSYTIAGLSGGTTYYFKVRAGNGCMPGDYSGEISATPTGGFVAGPAAGFVPGVLGVATPTASPATGGEVLGSQPGKVNWPWWMGGIGLGLLFLAGYYFYRRREE